MNCFAVRDRLPELAVDTLPTREALAIDRHLSWCAACRKEAEDLRRAASVLPYALPPARPESGLEERIVELVREASGARRPGSPRTRTAAAALIAAMVAVSALGWGAVMAGRADRLTEQVAAAERAQRHAIQQFATLIRQQPGGHVYLGKLDPVIGRLGGGAALVLSSPPNGETVVVQVDGLPTGAPNELPYSAVLENDMGGSVSVGKIVRLDSGGGGKVARRFGRDLSGFVHVWLLDVAGNPVMAGELQLQGPLPSPSP